MAYDLHLVRLSDGEESPISLDEWTEALKAVEGVRPSENDWVGGNPNTGEEIRIPNAPGDAKVRFPDEQAWHKIFRFSHGRATLRHPDSRDRGTEAVWRVVARLCERLDLVAEGDEGERYDPETVEMAHE